MRKRFHTLGSLAVFSVLLSLGLSLATAGTLHAATELANINGSVITLENFNQRYKDNLKFFQFKAPAKKDVLDDLVKRELGIQEARKLGLYKDPEVIERMNTVLYQALLDKRLSKEFEGIHITDDEAKSFYSKNPEIRTSHIFVAVRPDAKPEEAAKALERIKGYEKELKAGKMSFSEVAQRFSDGPAAPMGGDIDFQGRDKLDPTYYETALKLKQNAVSGIIRSPFGYHIIRLAGIRGWDETDQAQVKRLVFEQRRTQIFERFMSELRKQAKVRVNSDLLKD